MSENTVKITDANFNDEVIKSDKPVLVDFWAEWCGPCKMLAPVIEDIAETFSDKIKVGKLNVEENQEVASQFGVMSIPTIIYFAEGEPEERVVGYQPKEALIKKFNLS